VSVAVVGVVLVVALAMAAAEVPAVADEERLLRRRPRFRR
jgi:hypothetical protein